jgi:hypothetical protein
MRTGRASRWRLARPVRWPVSVDTFLRVRGHVAVAIRHPAASALRCCDWPQPRPAIWSVNQDGPVAAIDRRFV